jgi:hypothetical protein
MIIKDEDLLDEFRGAKKCEWCRRRVGGPAHPHHIWARGMGGGNRMDVRENLISLCLNCHQVVHNGEIPRDAILVMVARREKVSVEEICDKIWTIQRTPARHQAEVDAQTR